MEKFGSLLGYIHPSGAKTGAIDQLHRATVIITEDNHAEETLRGVDKSIFKNTGAASLSSIFLPYQMYGGSVSGSVLPIVASGGTGDILMEKLLPFHYDPSADYSRDLWAEASGDRDSYRGVISDDSYLGYRDRYRNKSSIRGIGLRLPAIGVGWGYDTDDNPVPAGTGTGMFAGEVPSGYQVDPQAYVAAPIDLRYDVERKVWTTAGGSAAKHQHLKNSTSDGGPAFANFFADNLAEASGLGYLSFLPELGTF